MGDDRGRGREAGAGDARLALEARKSRQKPSPHYEFAFTSFARRPTDYSIAIPSLYWCTNQSIELSFVLVQDGDELAAEVGDDAAPDRVQCDRDTSGYVSESVLGRYRKRRSALGGVVAGVAYETR